MTPLNTRRWHRTTGDAFKDADYGQAIWPPEKRQSSAWDAIAAWGAVALCVLAFVVYHSGPSEIEAIADMQADLSDAQAAAVVAAATRK